MRNISNEEFGIGEYPEVIKKIKNKEYLIKAHSTPCKKDKAVSIINYLKILLPPNIKLQILFKGKRKDGFAGFLNNELNEKVFLIELPTTPMPRCGNWRRKLRIGLVLHEFSHIYDMAYMNEIKDITQEDVDKIGHDSQFIKTFDMILKFYYDSL